MTNDDVHGGASLLRAFALRANRGIELTPVQPGELLARPMIGRDTPDLAVPQIPLAAVPAHQLEMGANFLRHVWRERKTSAVWWLYFHPQQSKWIWHCPPQLCSEIDLKVDPSFKDCETPDPDLWLAGSFRSVPPGVGVHSDQVAELLPPHQGVHFILHLAQPLTSISACIRCPHGVCPAPLGPIIDDPLDPSLAYLSDRLLFRTVIDSKQQG